MKNLKFVVAMLIASPAWAQSVTDDAPAIESWWDKVGADFFNQASLTEPRPQYEILAQWTALSKDDQAAVLARCAAGPGGETAASPSLQEGVKDEDQGTTAAELADQVPAGEAGTTTSQEADDASTTTTGSADGAEIQVPSNEVVPPADTGLAGLASKSDGSENMVLICDVVPGL